MSGGIRRLVTALKSIENQRPSLILVNGNLGGPMAKRQDQLKVEAIAETLRDFKNLAINPGLNDARLGLGAYLAIDQLSKQKLLLSDLKSPSIFTRKQLSFGGLKVSSVRSDAKRTQSLLASTELISEFTLRQSQVVMFDGNREQATALAKQNPYLKLIIFNDENASILPQKIGKVWLVSPGSQGKKCIEIRLKNGVFTRYSLIDLAPEIADDKKATTIYGDYLTRVTSEKLIDKMPRSETDPYAGSKSCQPCHSDSYDIWKKSKHGEALATLEKDKHDRDPDCVSCHVVGLDSKSGFMSRAKTPDLANVGCESCHGPAKAHVMNPSTKTTKSSMDACMSCHNPNHSPKFELEEYWKKIAHGK